MTDREQALKEHGYKLVEEAVPPIGRSVMVVTKHLRCPGYLDASMNWRYVRDHGLLRDVIAWAALGMED